jgi:hypothetical protein
MSTVYRPTCLTPALHGQKPQKGRPRFRRESGDCARVVWSPVVIIALRLQGMLVATSFPETAASHQKRDPHQDPHCPRTEKMQQEKSRPARPGPAHMSLNPLLKLLYIINTIQRGLLDAGIRIG